MNTPEPVSAKYHGVWRQTGVTGLDIIMQGGLQQGGVYILRGTPGTGKTTIASQICFHRITQNETAVYVTLLTESHARLLQHLRMFRFFSEGALARRFHLISAFNELEAGGLHAVAKLLGREILRHGASFLVLDGTGLLEDEPGSRNDQRRFMHDLQGFAEAAGCTTLMLTVGIHGWNSPKYTMSDGVFELRSFDSAMRTERAVQVHKLRGADFLTGAHFYRITEEGCTVYPRTDALYRSAQPPQGTNLTAKLSTGVAGLDAMTGGFPAASTTALLGASGTGKTTLGLQFISKASFAEPGLMFAFHESPDALRAKATALGMKLEARLADGTAEITWEPPYAGLVDAVAARVLENVRRRGVKRLFIDGIAGFDQTAFAPDQVGPVLAAFLNRLRGLGVTTMYCCDATDHIGAELHPPRPNIAAITDNFVLLRYPANDSVLERRISVLKMRSSAFDPADRRFFIGQGGIRVEMPPAPPPQVIEAPP